MHRVIASMLFASACLLLVGCDEFKPADNASGLDKDARQELFKLARMNGCTECHRVNAVVIGPSWVQISDRYKDAPFEDSKALLIERVKKGSSGNWMTFKGGDGMPPMERRVSAQAVEQLVEYILNLRR